MAHLGMPSSPCSLASSSSNSSPKLSRACCCCCAAACCHRRLLGRLLLQRLQHRSCGHGCRRGEGLKCCLGGAGGPRLWPDLQPDDLAPAGAAGERPPGGTPLPAGPGGLQLGALLLLLLPPVQMQLLLLLLLLPGVLW